MSEQSMRLQGTNASFEELFSRMQKAQKVAICCHCNPDGDALGTMLLLTLALDSLGKDVTPLLAEACPLPQGYTMLEGFDRIVAAEDYQETPDLFISVDVSMKSRLNNGEAVLERALDSVAFDHHPDHNEFTQLSYVDSRAAACSIVVWEFLQSNNIQITPGMANACYVAVMTDTGAFQFQNTDAKSFKVASEAMEKGAQVSDIATAIYQSQTIPSLKMQAISMSRISFAELAGLRVVYSWVNLQDYEDAGATTADTSELIDTVRCVIDTDVAFLLRETPECYRVSLRSKSAFNVAPVARFFEGGGHDKAAGCSIYASLEESLAQVLKAIEDQALQAK